MAAQHRRRAEQISQRKAVQNGPYRRISQNGQRERPELTTTIRQSAFLTLSFARSSTGGGFFLQKRWWYLHGLKANSPSAALSVTLRATFFFGPRGSSPPALLPRRGHYRPGQRPSAAGPGPWPGEGRPLPGSPQEGRAATRRFAATCRPGCEARRGAVGVGRALLTPNPGGGGVAERRHLGVRISCRPQKWGFCSRESSASHSVHSPLDKLK